MGVTGKFMACKPFHTKLLDAHSGTSCNNGFWRAATAASSLRSVLFRFSSGAREVHLERIDYHFSRRLTLSIGMAPQVSPR